jgi:ankyrin repeat protein
LIEFHFNQTPGVETDVVAVEHQRRLAEQEKALVKVVKEFKIKIERHLSRSEYEEASKSLSNFQKQNPPEIWKMPLSAIDFNVQEQQGLTFLMWAAHKGDSELVRLLIATGANLNIRDDNGNTALIWATANDHSEVVRLLIAAGADVNDRNKYDGTALIGAAYGGHTEVVKLLIAEGAVINNQDKSGRTALIWAAYEGHTEVVKHLIAAGADLNVQDNLGRTALSFAVEEGHTEVVRLIEEALRKQAESLSAAGEGDVDASP